MTRSGIENTLKTLLLTAAVLLISAGPAAPSPDDIIGFVEETAEWHRHAESVPIVTGTAEEALFHDALIRQADNGQKLGFAFGKAEAALLADSGSTTAPASGPSARLATATAAAAQRVNETSARLDEANRELAAAAQPAPDALLARRDKLMAELDLARSRQAVIRDFASFNGGSAEGLADKIDELARAIGVGAADAKPPAASTPIDANAARPEGMGLVGLVGELFSLTSHNTELKELDGFTAKIAAYNEQLRAPLRGELQAAIQRGDQLYKSKDDDAPAQLNAERQEIEALAAKYHLLTAAVVPLAEQMQVFDAVRGNLRAWREYNDGRYHRTAKVLIARSAAIATAILILLAISAVWRRAAFRYITDDRRRRQFLLVRRLIVGGFIVAILVTGAVTEFSTLATFAGLITAGVAVALQTVILSGVAHFFFIGRYGVRVGDRVTISGITGDVIDMGIFRLYLMELAGNGRDLAPTGRVVVFSNSVLFQPSAFFKQLPGAEYVWHELALTLATDTDHTLAENRLLGVVQSVVTEYQPDIQRQYTELKNTMHLNLPEPKPTGRLRFVDSGVEFVVRYPVDIRRSAEIDDQITRELIYMIAAEPKLKLVGSGTPRIQPAEAV